MRSVLLPYDSLSFLVYYFLSQSRLAFLSSPSEGLSFLRLLRGVCDAGPFLSSCFLVPSSNPCLCVCVRRQQAKIPVGSQDSGTSHTETVRGETLPNTHTQRQHNRQTHRHALSPRVCPFCESPSSRFLLSSHALLILDPHHLAIDPLLSSPARASESSFPFPMIIDDSPHESPDSRDQRLNARLLLFPCLSLSLSLSLSPAALAVCVNACMRMS